MLLHKNTDKFHGHAEVNTKWSRQYYPIYVKFKT